MPTIKPSTAQVHARDALDASVAAVRSKLPSGGAASGLLRDVLAGLRRRPKRLPSTCFYDEEGSRLFCRIMELPCYYLTRAEDEILRTHGATMAARFAGRRVAVIDLGAGDGSKTRHLLGALSERAAEVRYLPVDLSPPALASLSRAHAEALAGVTLCPIVADYASGLADAVAHSPGFQHLALFLGSNIGNLEARDALALLRTWRQALGEGDELLLGFDLLKDPAILQSAYDDHEGVTARFNLNVLERLNRELDANFDVASFRHFARYNPELFAMESYLVSERDQLVTVAGERFGFLSWEAMQTEVSCKYRELDVRGFAESAGFAPSACFYDSRRWFLDALWRVDGDSLV